MMSTRCPVFMPLHWLSANPGLCFLLTCASESLEVSFKVQLKPYLLPEAFPDPSTNPSCLIMVKFLEDTCLIFPYKKAVPHLHKVIVVWNNIGEKVPEDLWNALGPHPVPVIFKIQTVNRMRNRLQTFPELETKAVLMVDDDMLISAHDLVFAFSVWQQFPDQIVGFVPRKHVPTASGIYSYGGFELQIPGFGNGDQYSMVLIGASFFNRKYLEQFQKQPATVHALIDETQNCDDIAMNFMVAKHIGKTSGVFVKPVEMGNLEKETSSGYSGMWHRADHFLQRSYCINKLVKIYDSMPLKYSNIMISQFGFPYYANHKSKM
ncbi:exostosin-like 2 isoform X2 [Phascolarctos cinereus]|uniref:Exostosin-like 2 n=1 Tax=Phascolarctos cinereus TaxID=38626 RepID=A0A6P5LIT8_PHACI|nr:exostosin-like 2 isoform X2 [Phascolarctos cinereus]XP_020855642.1 exostosin-like 2 isoform X2 [Phascolarctos cinereus]